MAEGGMDESSGAVPEPPGVPAAARTSRTVFLSYASHDAEIATAICRALESQGVPCWIAPRDVTPGALYADEIVGAINDAKAVVLVLSEHAVASPHVGKEIERASSKRRRIIVLRIDSAPLTRTFEYFLSESQWIDVPALGMPAALTKLGNAVRQVSTPSLNPNPDQGGAAILEGKGFNRFSRSLVAAAIVILAAIAITLAIRLSPSKHGDPEAPAVAAISDKSIAVLPFADMSEKKDQEYFADGMAEEVLDLLEKIPALKVIGRTSSFQFKGQNADLRKIGGALGAAYVVEGSVRKSGDRVRVTAQLIDTRAGTHIWSGAFEREVGDALKMQDEIAANLVRALQVSVSADELRPRPALTNVEAYNRYLRGRHSGDRFDEEGFEQAAGYFQQAIDLDPTFAPAAAWLSMTYDAQGEWGFVAPGIAFEHARAAAESALKLDPKFFLPYAVLGSIHTVYDWDWTAGQAALKQAIVLAPHEPLTQFFAARSALIVGRYDEALAHIQATLAQDPLMPTGYLGVCWIQQRRGHLLEAEAAARRALEISPTYVSAHFYLGLVLLARNDSEAALAAMRQEGPLGGQLGGLAMAYYALGRKAESDAALARFIKEQQPDFAFGIAEVYAYRGERDAAFQWLERAYTQRDSSLYLIKGDPPLRNLESDPRYQAFLRKMNLPE